MYQRNLLTEVNLVLVVKIISTNKLPPRGPVGLNQLTSYKYVVKGNELSDHKLYGNK